MDKRKAFIFYSVPLLVVLPSWALAYTCEIYTYGSGDFLASIFNGIKMLIEGGYLTTLIKILLIVGLLMGILSPLMGFFGARGGGYAFHGPEGLIALIRTAIVAGIIVYGLMLPKANVAIIDRSDPSQTQVVSNVPLVNAVIASVSSRIGDVVGKQIEDIMVPVDAVRFRKNGVAIGAKYLNEILDIEPPVAPAEYGGTNNVSISVVLGEYFERCVFPNFVYIAGSNSPAALGLRVIHQSPDILNDLPAIGNEFRDPNIYFNANFDESNPVTCANAPEQIQTQWNSIFYEWLKQVNYRLLGGNSDDPGYIATIQELFERYFPDSQVSFQDGIKQLAVLNSIRYALISYAARNGDYYIKDMLMEQKTGSGWIEAGRLFNRIVQTMRMLIEGVIYGASAFLPVFFAIAGFGALVTFIKVNFWLQMWVPFYVILNAFADWQFARVIQDALFNPHMDPNYYGISFATVESVRSHSNLILGYIGAFSWSVPALAWGLLKGGEYAVTHALSTVTSGSGGQQIAQQVGAEVGGASNISVGNIGMGKVELMSKTFIGGQAAMAQAVSQSAAIRQYLSQTLWGGAGALDRWGVGQAIQIGKTVGVGGAYGGSVGRAMDVARIGETRTIGDVETFSTIASSFGGVEGFQRAISTRDYTRVGEFLGRYAEEKGISLLEASRQVGGLLGTREFISTGGFEKALGGAGIGGLRFSEAQRLLSDAARGEQMYRVARSLGFAVGREDFSGMFQGHLAMSAEASLTVPDPSVARRLNEMAESQGLGVRFSPGDRVRMAWTGRGEGGLSVSLIKGEAGGAREALDLTRSVRGLQEWSGRESQFMNIVSQRGVLGIDQPGFFNARTFLGLLKDSGADHVARSLAQDIGLGKPLYLESAAIDPMSGQLVSFKLSRGGSNVTEDYSRTQTGWEKKTVALESVESGLRRHTGIIDIRHDERYAVKDWMDKRREGGEEITMVTSHGVTTGYLAYDSNVGGPVLVSGNVRYGVGKEMVTATPDGSLLFQDVKVDPKTNKVVTGRESSLMISEISIVNPHDQRTYKVQIFTDTKTGNQLAIEGLSGTFWTRTQYEGDMHITEYRGYSQTGDVFPTIAERVVPGSGRYVGDIIKGVGELGGIWDRLKSGASKPGPQTTGEELNRQKSEWAEYFKRKGWKPVE